MGGNYSTGEDESYQLSVISYQCSVVCRPSSVARPLNFPRQERMCYNGAIDLH
jgi:hypothetical protein